MAVLMCVGVLVLSSILPGVQPQDTPTSRIGILSCARPSDDLFGSFDPAGSTVGIVAGSFGSGDQGSTTNTVRILNVNMVCEASGLTKDSLSSLSAIVQYECLDTQCGGMNMIFIDQFRLDCLEVDSVANFSGVRNGAIRTPAAMVVGNLSTPLMDECGECSTVLSDEATYCRACLDECTGLGKCLGSEAGMCCNYYNENDCVISCPDDLVPNSLFECVFDCGVTNLTNPEFGLLSVDTTFLGSVASYTCDSGYSLVGDAMRTCTLNGWDGTNPVCSEVTTPSESFTLAVTSSNCETSVTCTSSSSMGSCTVQFTQIFPINDDFSMEVTGPINSPIVLPLTGSTSFSSEATVTINSTTSTRQRNFTTEAVDARLTSANTALIAVGVILLSIAIAGCVILVVLEVLSCKGSWLSLIMLVVGVVVILVAIVLWVAVGSQVGTQDNTCDSAWQESRDGLIIAAFVFSIVTLIITTIAAIALCYIATRPCKDHKNSQWLVGPRRQGGKVKDDDEKKIELKSSSPPDDEKK